LKRSQAGRRSAHCPALPSGEAGFTLLEIVVAVVIGVILTALAIPVISHAVADMRMNSTVSAFSGALSSSRYQAIRDSQTYTLVLTAPSNTYVLTNTSTNTAGRPVLLSSYVPINGGAGSFTYSLCPNGTVCGAGGCTGNVNQPPALSFTHQGRQINVAVSEVGNVTATTIH
jgi:prepilin-type N-terminal cleavage/methylation domain-containing protein